MGRKRSFCSASPASLTRERAELLHGEDQPARRADLRDLLDRDEREQRPGARPPVLLVEEQPEDAVLAEELDDVPGKLVRCVDLRRARRDPLARDRPDEISNLELLVAQMFPGHARSLGREPLPRRNRSATIAVSSATSNAGSSNAARISGLVAEALVRSSPVGHRREPLPLVERKLEIDLVRPEDRDLGRLDHGDGPILGVDDDCQVADLRQRLTLVLVFLEQPCGCGLRPGEDRGDELVAKRAGEGELGPRQGGDVRVAHSGARHTASTLLPSGSRT